MKRALIATVVAVVIALVSVLAHTATLLPNARQVFIDRNGAPLVNGSVYFYTPNTTSPKNTWQDAAQTILNVNPVALDAAGSAIIYGNGQYRQQVYDISGNLIWDQVTQDIQGLLGVYWGGTSGGSGNAQTLSPSQPLISYSTPLTITFIAGFSNTAAMTINVSGLGNKNVFKITSAGPAALAGSEIIANNTYQLIYDGTEFVLVNLLPASNLLTEPVNAQAGATYTMLSTDQGKLVTFSNSVSVTIPQSGSGGNFTNGWFADVSNITSGGTVTLTPTVSTIDGLTSLNLSQNQGIRIVSDGSNYFTVRGRQGTGNSGGTSSGAFTETVFSSSSSFTTPLDSSNTTVYWFEIVAGGGGGGGSDATAGAGGGGAGCTAIGTFTSVAPGTSITITVGGAGAAGLGAGPGAGGSGGNSAIGAPVSITAVGGAGSSAGAGTQASAGGFGCTTATSSDQSISGGDGNGGNSDSGTGVSNGGTGGASSKGGGGRGSLRLGGGLIAGRAGQAFGSGGGGAGNGGGFAGAPGLVTIRRMTQ